ncbi:MAG: 2-dehydro-3-deoxygalactonokinase [Clostridiales bacterium]|nr:2-dehydro-3-deoxygalactonokinase [Clostridiales bacterium]
MKQCHVLIDGGTTNTRFILMDGETILTRCRKRSGAGAAESSGNQSLFMTVKETLEELERDYDCQITDVFSSGMITSGQGLYELEHINAPASLEQLVRGVKKVRLPEISETIYAEKVELGEISYEESETLSLRGLIKIRDAYRK